MDVVEVQAGGLRPRRTPAAKAAAVSAAATAGADGRACMDRITAEPTTTASA
ncbi:hypothetical protein OG232_03780 [Streptomyces sp. NBC_01411]|uniref:hypothetical protein n=1 Tax=Streptomyces sp. NBC_01411 TaxID=2903857 RepID=UPI003248EF32